MTRPTVALLGVLIGLPLDAAQTSLTASQATLLEDIEQVLREHQVQIDERASTERFTLIYATRREGGQLTVTVHRTPEEETRQHVRVVSASPADPDFDASLLAAIRAVQD